MPRKKTEVAPQKENAIPRVKHDPALSQYRFYFSEDKIVATYQGTEFAKILYVKWDEEFQIFSTATTKQVASTKIQRDAMWFALLIQQPNLSEPIDVNVIEYPAEAYAYTVYPPAIDSDDTDAVQIIPQAAQNATDAQKIPWKLLFASPLDPRKSRSEEQILELANSIFEKGMLQNLTARAVGERFEIAAGNTRYLAVGRLIAQGRATKDYLVPVQVRDLTDRELLEIALTENSKRTNMHPLEDADAYAELERMGASREEIAARVGKSVQTVHRRIALSKLEISVRAAFLANKINTSQAEAFTIGTHDQQRDLLKVGLSNGGMPNYSGNYIRNHLTEKRLLVEHARFDLGKYTGEITQDLFGEIKPFFTDAKQAEKLQRIEAKALVEQYQTEWAWARVVDSYVYSGTIEIDGTFKCLGSSKDRKKAGVIVQVNPKTLEITEHVGCVIPDAKSKAVEKAESAEAKAKRDRTDIREDQLAFVLSNAIGQPVKIYPYAQAYLERIPRRCEFDPKQNTRSARLDLLLVAMRPQVARVSLLRLLARQETGITVFRADVPNPSAMDSTGRFWLAFDGSVYRLGLWGWDAKNQDIMPTVYDDKPTAEDVTTDAILKANQYASRTKLLEVLNQSISILTHDYEKVYLDNNN